MKGSAYERYRFDQSVTDAEIIRLLNETVLRSECLNSK